MRNLLCLLLVTFTCLGASAQRVFFIYLQTDNGSAFYVKMGEKIMSSSSAGYMVLSGLADSTHHLAIGFPATGTELKYRIPLSGKDRGLLIKYFDFGWGLFDLQQLNIIRPQIEEGRSGGTYRVRNDDFSLLLSRAARDSSLLIVPITVKQDLVIEEPKPAEKPVVLVQEKKQEPAKDTVNTETVITEVPMTDTLVVLRQEAVKDSKAVNPPPVNVDSLAVVQERKEKDEPPITERKLNEVNIITAPVEDKKLESTEIYKKTQVKKYSESSTSEGFGLVYFDVTSGGIDTIRLLIPNPPILLKQEDTVQHDQRFLDITEVNAAKKTEPAIKKEVKKIVPTSNCKELSSKADFMKLRRNMAAETTDEAMVDEAKKYFRSKCFTTEQVKNLGALFLSSAGKYLFYDAAYFHVTDRENYPSLASELRDDYYLKRFKALIGE